MTDQHVDPTSTRTETAQVAALVAGFLAVAAWGAAVVKAIQHKSDAGGVFSDGPSWDEVAVDLAPWVLSALGLSAVCLFAIGAMILNRLTRYGRP